MNTEVLTTIIVASLSSGLITKLIDKLLDRKSADRDLLIFNTQQNIVREANRLIEKKDVSTLEWEAFERGCLAYFKKGGNSVGRMKYEEAKSTVHII